MADESGEKTVGKQVNLSPVARRVLDTIKEKYGVTQQSAVERGLERLLALPREVLQEVFAADGDPWGRLAQIKIAEQAGADPNATSIEQAAAIARAQVERLARMAKSYRQELDDVHGGQAVEKVARKKPGGGGKG